MWVMYRQEYIIIILLCTIGVGYVFAHKNMPKINIEVYHVVPAYTFTAVKCMIAISNFYF